LKAHHDTSIPDCLTCPFQENSFFCKLVNKEDMSALMMIKKGLSFDKRQTIFKEGNSGHGIYILCSGSIILKKTGPNHRNQILSMIFPGDIIDKACRFHSDSHSVTAETLEKSTVSFFAWEALTNLLNSSEHFNRIFIQALIYEIEGLRNKNYQFLFESAMQRLIDLLLCLSEESKHILRHELVLEFGLKRNEMADMIGITNETLIRLLSELKNKNLISMSGKTISILDKQKLALEKK
jgi:CRP-like cAMP-binding protein